MWRCLDPDDTRESPDESCTRDGECMYNTSELHLRADSGVVDDAV